MRLRDNHQLVEFLNDETMERLETEREKARTEAREQILEIQRENQKHSTTFNKRRRHASQYQVGDLVAVKRTQLGLGLKLKPKYLGPYRIGKVKDNDTYDVIREGTHEGPKHITTCAEYIKRWREPGLSSESETCKKASHRWEIDSSHTANNNDARETRENRERQRRGGGERTTALRTYKRANTCMA